MGGRVGPELAAFREALRDHLPRAVQVLGELLASPEKRIRLAAAVEVCDRVLGEAEAS